MVKSLLLDPEFITQDLLVKVHSWFSVNNSLPSKLYSSKVKESPRVWSSGLVRSPKNQLSKLRLRFQRLTKQPRVLNLQSNYKLKKFGAWTDLPQFFLSRLKMHLDKFLTKQLKVELEKVSRKPVRKILSLLSSRTLDWITELLIWECLQIRP